MPYKNTANQNTGMQLYIQQYYIQPSHHFPLIVLAAVFSIA